MRESSPKWPCFREIQVGEILSLDHIYIYIHTYRYTFIHTYIHIYRHDYENIYTCTYNTHVYMYIYTCTYISISAAPCLASSDSRERSLCRLWRCQCRWSDVSETGIQVPETLFFGSGKKSHGKFRVGSTLGEFPKKTHHFFGGLEEWFHPIWRFLCPGIWWYII